MKNSSKIKQAYPSSALAARKTYLLGTAGLLVVLLSASTLQPFTAQADDLVGGYQPRIHPHVDKHGVDLGVGSFYIGQPEISTAGLSKGGHFYLQARYYGNNEFDRQRSSALDFNLDDNIGVVGQQVVGEDQERFLYVTFGGKTESYKYKQGGFFSAGTSENLLKCGVFSSAISQCKYYLKDGTIVNYSDDYRTNACERHISEGDVFVSIVNCIGVVSSVERPNGEIINYTYTYEIGHGGPFYGRTYISSIKSNFGWSVIYKINGTSSASILNNSIDYCTGVNTGCTLSNASMVPTIKVETSTANGVNSYAYSDADDKLFYTLSTNFNPGFTPILWQTSPLGVTKYYYTDETSNESHYRLVSKVKLGSYEATYAFKEFDNHKHIRTQINEVNSDFSGNGIFDEYYFIMSDQNLKYAQNTFRSQVVYDFDTNGMVTKVTNPEGNYTEILYDTTNNVDRKNVKRVRVFPKVSNGTYIETSFTYEECNYTTYTNIKYCNKPKTVTEPPLSGTTVYRVTDYEYWPEHGGVKKVTLSPDEYGVRPQTRYTYDQYYATIKNSSGVPTLSTTPIWLLKTVSTCRSATNAEPASCVGTSEETVTSYKYDHPNLLKTEETVAAGNANVNQPASPTNVWATTKYTYNYAGDFTSVDGPLPGTDDKAYTSYDVRRRPIYEIGPDPDGVGPLRRQIVQHLYNLDGQENLTKTGTCADVILNGDLPTGCTDISLTSYSEKKFDPVTGLLLKTKVAKP